MAKLLTDRQSTNGFPTGTDDPGFDDSFNGVTSTFNTISTGAIVGIVISAVFLIGLLILAAWAIYRVTTRRRRYSAVDTNQNNGGGPNTSYKAENMSSAGSNPAKPAYDGRSNLEGAKGGNTLQPPAAQRNPQDLGDVAEVDARQSRPRAELEGQSQYAELDVGGAGARLHGHNRRTSSSPGVSPRPATGPKATSTSSRAV